MAFPVLMIWAFLLPQTPAATQPTPTDVLRTTLAAIEKVEAVEYEVRHEYSLADARKFKGRTTILAARNPLRFRARLQGEDLPVVELAVADGKTNKLSTAGKLSETPIFATSNPQLIIGVPVLEFASRASLGESVVVAFEAGLGTGTGER